MTAKERMLITIRNGRADRVPVCPDLSNMIPARLTGKPFWEVFAKNDPPLWKAWLAALDYFGFDGYLNCEITFKEKRQYQEVLASSRFRDGRLIEKHVIHTPEGDLDYEWTYFEADSPALTVKPIKNLKEDLPRLKFLFPQITDYDREPLTSQEKMLGSGGVSAIYVSTPGFGNWFAKWFDGGLEQIVYEHMDHPELIEELRRLNDEYGTRQMELVLDAKPDCIEVGIAGGITMSSPDLFRKISLPTIKKHTRMAKEAGVPSVLHCCGKQRACVEMCALETDLNCINPLEIPPQGDCDLKEIKQTFGHRLSLMGNLHTTDIMLQGTPEDVEAAAMQAIDAAGQGGGFILSTGDQCGRDTPDENIHRMVEVARNYGRYD